MKDYKLFLNDRVYFKYGKATGDPEKLVLPSIIFLNTNHEAFGENRTKGFVLCFGWWDYCVKIGLIYKTKKEGIK